MAYERCRHTRHGSSCCYTARGQMLPGSRTSVPAQRLRLHSRRQCLQLRPVLGICGGQHLMAAAAVLLRCCDAACTLNMQQQVY